MCDQSRIGRDHVIQLGWKHTMVTPLGCHIVLFSMDVHVWIYPISNFWENFRIFLDIMLKYNLAKRLEKKLFHLILISGRLEYICENKCNVLVYSKTQMYSKKHLNDF